MTSHKRTLLSVMLAVCFGFLAPLPHVGAQVTQDRTRAVVEANRARGPFSDPLVLDAPFVADATVTAVETTTSGVRSEWTTTWRIYRDSAGRARVDYETPLPKTGGTMRTVMIVMPLLELYPGVSTRRT